MAKIDSNRRFTAAAKNRPSSAEGMGLVKLEPTSYILVGPTKWNALTDENLLLGQTPVPSPAVFYLRSKYNLTLDLLSSVDDENLCDSGLDRLEVIRELSRE
jgi:hypothetical protein